MTNQWDAIKKAQQSNTEKLSKLHRDHDPGKGSFDPVAKDPGVRHYDKTRQDQMPKDQRPRVKEWQARQAKMRKP